MGKGLKTEKMPGHWVLARLGKRVLRPGGMELTRRMLKMINFSTATMLLSSLPAWALRLGLHSSQALLPIRQLNAMKQPRKLSAAIFKGERQHCVVGSASDTGLPDECATVVYGEAMLTMQTEEIKRQIVREAYRLLKSGGRYGIHEMCLMSDRLDEAKKKETERALTGVVHHGVRPLSVSEWSSLLQSEGFSVQSVDTAPMSLLEPGRLIRDEGLAGALRFAWNLCAIQKLDKECWKCGLSFGVNGTYWAQWLSLRGNFEPRPCP